jgi:hypothetical protein
MANLVPVPFPVAQFDNHVYFKKDKLFLARMSRDRLLRLYQRGCVDVAGFAAQNCTLLNAIHPLFAHGNFTDFTAAEYAVIGPALRLASRFITDPRYLGFWAKLYAGHADIDPSGAIPDEYELVQHTATTQHIPILQRNARVLQFWNQLSGNLTFRSWDAAFTAADATTVGEAYPDLEDYQHKRHWAINGNSRTCGCMYCLEIQNFHRCVICGDTEFYYRDRKCTIAELRRMLNARKIPNNHLRLKTDLVDLLEADDLVRNGGEPNRDTTTAAQRSHLVVGLRWDALEHNRDVVNNNSGWSNSEEIRFQFGLASTLCHELAHVFWWCRSRLCWVCFPDDPYWSVNEVNYLTEPELGKA